MEEYVLALAKALGRLQQAVGAVATTYICVR